jgi:hypothetical protein
MFENILFGEDYSIAGYHIKKTAWEQDEKKMLVKAFRELQQKRLMEDPTIKKLKASLKKGERNYLCPVCNEEGHDCLQAAHHGIKIITIISVIYDKYHNTHSFYQMLNKIIEEENKSYIVVCCRTCNKDLEWK